MITIPYHLYDFGIATENLVSVQAVANGPIVAITLSGMPPVTAVADAAVNIEVSFLPAGVAIAQDSRSVIAKMLLGYNYHTTASAAQIGQQMSVSGLLIPWSLGERLYLNLNFLTGSGVDFYAAAIVHQAVDDKDYARMSGRII